MPIFRVSGTKLQKVRPVKLEGSNREKQLQRIIEDNLDTIFEMTFINSETPTKHGGRIDTLAIDEDNRPVIIEYKAEKSSTILLQGLYYMDWLVEYKADFEKLVRIKLGTDIDINWNSGIRLLLIARSFEFWDKFAVNRIKEDVELYEYQWYENDELKLDKTALPKDFRSVSKTSITTITEYSILSHLDKIKVDSIREVVEDLREKIMLISDDIKESSRKDLIVYKSSVNFAAIYTQTKNFWFDVKLPKEYVKKEFSDLDVRPHKDQVFTHIRYSDTTDINQLVSLAEEAFENTL